MKFTKLTSAALVSATVLSALVAPATTFAATPEHDAAANGGTELPQTDNTTVGISFGDNSDNGNTGFLRLQMVPHILDFGNHTLFDAQYPTFNAEGLNVSKADNNRHANYKGGDTNMTAVLNSDDAALKDVNGKAWATVVDKQTAKSAGEAGKNDNVAGDWQLYVKADGPLVAKTNGGNVNSEIAAIDDATLTFKNTAYDQTQEVFKLTNEDQDSDFVTSGTAKEVSDATINKNISLQLATPTDASDKGTQVATAATGEGEGANVFGWNRSDIQLTLPKTAQVSNAIYESQLTWTLATGM